ncbi:SGNH/GDSL hydrolase family protein [Dyella amyloliquefaciens]|uniref:SGNH/GDSL hydrolase family protein n=1 Tax=Dyella amyloliquefaciens TaxID=1770545 RepID=UPI00102E2B50|nr:SGNH/GDSL hydrolase family protein [Dyella amyloliquefaciens]
MWAIARIRRFLTIAFLALLFATPVYAAPSLPKVLIIGDSISQGYTPHVTTLLGGEAEVIRNPENGQTSAYGLERMDEWLGSTKWDVISFNFGQWDFCYHNPSLPDGNDRDKIHGAIAISLDQYKRNLEAIVERLQRTKAHLIWENSTFVPEGESGRYPEDAIKYNQAAKEIMDEHSIPVVDLYNLTKGFEPKLFKRPQNVHYSDEGYREIATTVARAIQDALRGPSHRSP